VPARCRLVRVKGGRSPAQHTLEARQSARTLAHGRMRRTLASGHEDRSGACRQQRLNRAEHFLRWQIEVTKPGKTRGLVSVSSRSTGAPESVALGYPSRFARRRPVNGVPFDVTVNVIEHNRAAWNRESVQGSEWSTPVTPEIIAAAREGAWAVILTPTRKVPASWFGDLRGKDILCLASGGGQQAPVLAAAGANVVSFDLSDEQLNKDREVAERETLQIQCVRGDMADLGQFRDEAFDLIFHPVSNVFVPDVMPVWRECYRVLKPEGRLLAGLMNPCFFLFDHDKAHNRVLAARYPLPYGEPGSLSGDARRRWEQSQPPAQFSHSLESQIGGQTTAGFAIVGLYEDYWSDEATPLNRFFPVALATLAVKVTSNRVRAGC
jgi:SAM-dependent methyltransferase